MEISIASVEYIALVLTVGFGFACLLGYFSFRLHLSPILGYLVAGYLIGPFSPGFVADPNIAEQLAVVGVILMMFGVGLHFNWQDLIGTRRISIPGAIVQISVATAAGILLIHSVGWSIQAGIVFGLSISVASTMVLVRVLTENRMLKTPEGLISVGWLIVEDIVTVIMLLLVPTLAASKISGAVDLSDLSITIAITLLKFAVLVAIMFTAGRWIIRYIFSKVSPLRSHELFTLTILAITFAIATGASHIFGLSITLGAFIAGMVIGQSVMHRQIVLHTVPLQDAFVVIFFLTVGMLFNPMVIYEYFWLFLGTLAIVLVVKPLTAYLISIVLKQPRRTACIVGLALAQIGEFSFILAEEAMRFDLLPDDAFDILVACAIVSLAVNPPLFKALVKKM